MASKAHFRVPLSTKISHPTAFSPSLRTGITSAPWRQNRASIPIRPDLWPRNRRMTFTTSTFPIFLAIVFALYWSVRGHVAQNRVLLVASYSFYAWWDWRFCFLMLGSSLVDFELSRRIHLTANHARRKWLLATSLLSNLGLLAIFKYYNFFIENLLVLTSKIGWAPDINTISWVLPLGISFYTFQTLGYTIDVYRKRIPAAANVTQYLAFVSFFPQLVAGPIERAEKMLPQFGVKRQFNLSHAKEGSKQILWGFFKKMVIADRLALAVNPVFDDPSIYSGPHLMMATIFFAFQIYCDFSAYSDIAIGTAKLFNLRLTQNFAYPYFSQSISEFWRRWHISLSYWFRDYVYIPLGGNQHGSFRRRMNLVVTFLVSGLWHGPAWGFIAWGGVNGLAVSLPGFGSSRSEHAKVGLQPAPPQAKSAKLESESATSNEKRAIETPGAEPFLPRPITLVRIYATFATICATWILFRATSFSDAVLIYQQIATDLFNGEAYRELLQFLDADRYQRKTATFLLVFVCWEWVFRRDSFPLQLRRVPLVMRWMVYTTLIWSTLYLMPKTGVGEFVYFEF